MFCPKCKSEYRDGFWECAECNIKLVTHLPSETEQDVEYVNLVNIEKYSYLHEADLAKGFLSVNGIEAFVQEEGYGFGSGTPVHLFVKEEDALRAKEILEGIKK